MVVGFWVYEVQPVNIGKIPPVEMRYPQQFNTEEDAQAFITERKKVPAFTDTEFIIRPDNTRGAQDANTL